MKKIFFICFIFSLLLWNINNVCSQNITAKYNKHKVDSLVNTINPDAKLRWITSDSVSIKGTSLSWNYWYGYFSEEVHTNYFFHATLDSVVYDSLNHLAPLGIMYIDTLWFDSDTALALAENQGGVDFRNHHTGFKIIASLGKPLVPNSTNRWYIQYISLDDHSDRLHFNLDATASTVDEVKKFEILSPNLVLQQNYPNPFNSTTTIRFAIPKAGLVELKVYDIRGKELRTLVKEHITPGNYFVDFDGSELASGIYFYKLIADNYIEIKKLILLK